MTESYWKTGSAGPRREYVQWPSPGQILRQAGIVALVGILWGALFVEYLHLTSRPTEGSLPVESAAVVPAPTGTSRLRPADAVTPTLASVASGTSATPPVPTLTATPESAVVQATSTELLPTPTDTPAPSPSPAETPTVPSNTPVPSEKVSAVSFAGNVLPILERRCAQCHGGDKTEQGLILKTYAGVLAGSWNGTVVEPGSAKDSFLVKQVVSGKMPKKGPRLLPSEIQIIRDWIDAGAPDN